MFRYITTFILLVIAFFASDVHAADIAPVAWWKFDVEKQETVLDMQQGLKMKSKVILSM